MGNESLRHHLKSRWIDPDFHRIWIDEQEGVATFPLWNLSEQLVGYQQYRPDSDKKKRNKPKDCRYFTHCRQDIVRVWGLESWNMSEELVVVEGVFKAAKMHSLGFASVAVLSNNLDPSTKAWLSIVRSHRKVVVVGDPGEPGKSLLKFGHCWVANA